MYTWQLVTAHAQGAAISEENVVHSSDTSRTGTCRDNRMLLPIKQALRLVCQRNYETKNNESMRKAIVIGFVGGFVKSSDVRHPEVNFAALLRDRDPSVVHAAMFSNHDGKKARRRVLQLLDTDGDGALTKSHREGASDHHYLWTQLGSVNRHTGSGIRKGRYSRALSPIQLDSVRKPRQDDTTIADNVENAINFYQPRGLIHGRSVIRAADRHEPTSWETFA